jgi:very-short-patch-repair endonuclease
LARCDLSVPLLEKEGNLKRTPLLQRRGVRRMGWYMHIHNLKKLKDLRKDLRKHLTPAEAVLWKALQSRRLEGRKSRRQHSIGNFIVDFYCSEERLVIELDGEVHNNSLTREYDELKTNFLKSFGIKVIRFENRAVFDNLEGVLNNIKDQFGNHP